MTEGVSTPILPLAPAGAAAVRPSDQERRRLAARVRLLSWFSLGYMALEGGVAILAGVLAGSVALIGFCIDSAIEGFANAIIVWRFTGARVFSDAAEQRAQKLVPVQFFLLAPYVGFESISALVAGDRPDVSRLGIALSASSLVVMPYLGMAKQRFADRLGSAAIKGGPPEHAVRIPDRGPAGRAAGQRAARRLVAGSRGRAAHRGRGGEGGPGGVAG